MKRIRALDDRRTRREQGAFFFEGAQPVWRAVEAGVEIETLVIAPELVAGTKSEQLVAEQEARGVPVARLTAELFTRLSMRDGPAGIAAIAKGAVGSLDGWVQYPDEIYVVLHDIAGPGNLGSIIRTADAAGAGGVILVGNTTDPYSAAAVKASMGSVFNVRLAHEPSVHAFIDWTEHQAITLLTTSARGKTPYQDAVYVPPLAIMFGSEGDGLPADVLARGDMNVRIPMAGSASSLNLSVAVGVMLFEAKRHQ